MLANASPAVDAGEQATHFCHAPQNNLFANFYK